MASSVQNEGFKTVLYKEFDKSADSGVAVRSILESYTLTVSSQLASYLSLPSSGVTSELYPNVCELMIGNNAPTFHYATTLTLDFLNDSYSIIITELPIKNYKNKENQSDGGLTQEIIANIPAPFVDSNLSRTNNNALISAVFQPNFKVITNMKNQLIQTNHLRVKIQRMRDDKPATEIQRAVINFTIYKD